MAKNKYKGDYIRPVRLDEYPAEAQKMMFLIVNDFEENYITVIENKGSYSIKSILTNDITVKVSCTSETSVALPGIEVAVLFRDNAIEKLDLDNVNKDYPSLNINKRLLAAGSADRIKDFYFTVIDSQETYQNKKNDIIKLTKELVSRKYESVEI